jgi:MSHA biogenesis protein MshO
VRALNAPSRRPAGFTLVELIIVIVIAAVIAVALTSVMRPLLNAYVDTRARAEMADVADTALRRMLRDVRQAVPNSIRSPNSQCFELVPTKAGGRYRMGPAAGDTVDAATGDACTPSASCSAALEHGRTVSAIDSLSGLSPAPSVGDFVVINNQSTNDVYAGSNRVAITSVASPAPAHGRHRLGFAATAFPAGYDGGRFTIVAASQQSVFYVCAGTDNGNLDSRGDGKGTLYRVTRNFTATYPASCPSVTGAAVVATKIRSCTFVYDPNKGATQQSGFIWMDLGIARNNETAHLATGGHVQNSP